MKQICSHFQIELFSHFELSPGGEIGRRTVFRSQRSQGCAGSNPVPGTCKTLIINLLQRFYFFNALFMH